MNRRTWLEAAGAAIAAAWTQPLRAAGSWPAAPAQSGPFKGPFCLFSKHLPALNWDDLGRAVKDAGFDGVDLTVRTGGHVLPERAVEDLPRAIDAIRRHGLTVPMITTEIVSASDRTARPLLEAAGKAGVRFFKPGYWKWGLKDVHADIEECGRALAELTALARASGVAMGFHNHAGNLGSAIWDIAPQIEKLEKAWAGFYYDPRHAVAEGGGGAWKAATKLVAPRLKMIAIKDFFWEKRATGWAIRDCPTGEGMVDWTWFASAMRDAHYEGPVSLHLEYEIPGATPAERTTRTLDAARRDLGVIRARFEKAYS